MRELFCDEWRAQDRKAVPPLRGLKHLKKKCNWYPYPGLPPWARLFRPYGAGSWMAGDCGLRRRGQKLAEKTQAPRELPKLFRFVGPILELPMIAD